MLPLFLGGNKMLKISKRRVIYPENYELAKRYYEFMSTKIKGQYRRTVQKRYAKDIAEADFNIYESYRKFGDLRELSERLELRVRKRLEEILKNGNSESNQAVQ